MEKKAEEIKTKARKNNKKEENNKLDEAYNSSKFLNSTSELSFNNIKFLEKKTEFKNKITGFDNIIIPAFLNDFSINNSVNKDIEKYLKMKDEFESSEMAKLYLIDINDKYVQNK